MKNQQAMRVGEPETPGDLGVEEESGLQPIAVDDNVENIVFTSALLEAVQAGMQIVKEFCVWTNQNSGVIIQSPQFCKGTTPLQALSTSTMPPKASITVFTNGTLADAREARKVLNILTCRELTMLFPPVLMNKVAEDARAQLHGSALPQDCAFLIRDALAFQLGRQICAHLSEEVPDDASKELLVQLRGERMMEEVQELVRRILRVCLNDTATDVYEESVWDDELARLMAEMLAHEAQWHRFTPDDLLEELRERRPHLFEVEPQRMIRSMSRVYTYALNAFVHIGRTQVSFDHLLRKRGEKVKRA